MADFKKFKTPNDLDIEINMDHVRQITPGIDKTIEVLLFSDGSKKRVKKAIKSKPRAVRTRTKKS